jgi:hypothetical protein
MAEQSVFFGGRSPSGLTNLLLILNLLGIIIIIVLLLWWWPWYWGHGHGIVKDGATVGSAPGGNIIIDTCCDGGRTDCPTPPPPPGKTCQQNCNDRYGAGTTAAQTCVRDECCEDSCKQRYAGTSYYDQCVRTECGPTPPPPPPTETCEDYCKTVYGNPGMENYYQQCLQERCNPGATPPPPPPPDCRDSDGYNLATAGKVVSGGKSYPDSCVSSTEVKECVCRNNEVVCKEEPCQGVCEKGRCVPTTTPPPPTSNDPCREYCQNAYGTSGTQYVDQCVQQHWCPV